ncbi:MAG: 4-hydroxybenzoate 3-monooxygenase [Acidocella sp.]|nr:4-hydroxybenzoate 3-monooxygenase [Acidocella sp.]
MSTRKTRIGIIGAGPAGLMLSHLLHLSGIDNVVLEARPREYVENRIRAGILEYEVAQLLRETGLGARMDAEGARHDGTNFLVDGVLHHIDFQALVGKHVMLWSQHEVVRDLIAARLAAGGEIVFEAGDVAVHDYEAGSPLITYTKDGVECRLHCEIIAGCDGFHGICRQAFPSGMIVEYDRVYPFGWLGILAEAAPSADELIYANHKDGFALLSMRSPSISRLYLQCAPDEALAAWPDERVWEELARRLGHEGFSLNTGRIFQKSVTAMRSYVAEPMQLGRLFLAGDAAHIVPPTGAKGLNSAIADVVSLHRAIDAYMRHQDDRGLNEYTQRCLKRIWQIERFSWWMTSMMHKFDHHAPFDARMQTAELNYILTSPAGQMTLAENYVGLPLHEYHRS